MSDEQAVREASERFYKALTRLMAGDPLPMQEVWHHTPEVTSGHPMGSWMFGWEQIWTSWQEFAALKLGGSIDARDVKVFLHGDLAYTTGVEDVTAEIGGRPVRWHAQVTNIFKRVDGVWKTIHHHSDKAPSAEDAINKMMD